MIGARCLGIKQSEYTPPVRWTDGGQVKHIYRLIRCQNLIYPLFSFVGPNSAISIFAISPIAYGCSAVTRNLQETTRPRGL